VRAQWESAVRYHLRQAGHVVSLLNPNGHCGGREGGYAIGNTSAEFAELIRRDVEKHGKLVKSSGARPDQ